jgi:hypothetical protein
VATAVSLHSHTHHSKEVLAFLPGWVSRIPVVRHMLRHDMDGFRSRRQRTVDFSRAYWCPPMSPVSVLASEQKQLDARFGALALVSITDHDTIAANVGLAAAGFGGVCPISVEWTVPYRGSVFHLGVHNLPPDRAPAWMRDFGHFTANPVEDRLIDILAGVSETPATLIVLNHPLWNAHFDLDQDDTALAQFVRAYRPFLHATEINGYRSHAENKAVIALGRDWDMPVLAGGDRHGRAPNAMVNLTASATFDEFVAEVRDDGRSDVVVMPEYREHPVTRTLEVVADVLRTDRDADPGQRHWAQRVFVILDDGRHVPLAELWAPRGPLAVRACVRTASLLGSGTARSALRLGLAVEDGGLL